MCFHCAVPAIQFLLFIDTTDNLPTALEGDLRVQARNHARAELLILQPTRSAPFFLRADPIFPTAYHEASATPCYVRVPICITSHTALTRQKQGNDGTRVVYCHAATLDFTPRLAKMMPLTSLGLLYFSARERLNHPLALYCRVNFFTFTRDKITNSWKAFTVRDPGETWTCCGSCASISTPISDLVYRVLSFQCQL